MSNAEDLPRIPRRRAGRRRRIVVSALVVAVLLLVSLFRGIAYFYTDFLWFKSVHLTSVWSGLLSTKLWLAFLSAVLFFALMWVNIWVADHFAPRSLVPTQEDEIVQRYKELIAPHQRLVRTVVSLLLALFGGIGFYVHWDQWLLFFNGGSFGVKDPQFHRDIGFFVFKLPFYTTVLDWLFYALVFTLVVSAVAHYLQGAIPSGPQRGRVTSAVKAHASVLVGLLALVRAGQYYVERFRLSYSTRGVTTGANYTDVHFLLPALWLLVLISLLAGVLFFAGSRRKGWSIPIITVALWAVVSLLVGTVIPAGVQKLSVEPAESKKELPYIQRNIDATRAAIGLNNVHVHDFSYNDNLSAGDLQDNAQTVRNIRLWDPTLLQPSYQRLQETRSFFQFNDIGIDRYPLNDEETQMMLSVRELNVNQLPSDRQSWVNEHLQYTHGYGAVANPANAVTVNGQPDFTLKDVPPVGVPQVDVPQVYFGTAHSGANQYSVVDTGQPEIDYVSTTGQDKTSTYHGSGGVPLDNVVKKAAFAARVGDINPLISGLVGKNSKALYLTNIVDRTQKAAPFLQFDADPYPVILNGRILWVQDAYTTTNGYPYAQGADTTLVDPASGLKNKSFNYLRNSVKVVTDAYDGSMTFYVTDNTDPVIKAWQKSFPKMFTDGSKISPELRSHLRYPEDLYRVQSQMYGKYHMLNASDFYRQSDRWNIAQNPSNRPQGSGTSNTVFINGVATTVSEPRINPYYLLMRLPGETQESFLMFQPFVPYSQQDQRKELSAFMTAKSDPDSYGQMDVYVMPRDRQIDGPALVDARINQEPDISRQISLLNQQGSRVDFGNMLIIPIDNSLLYVRPLYVTAQQTAVPEFKDAIVVQGSKIAMEPTLQQALADVFGSAPATREQNGTSQPSQPSQPSNGTTVTPANPTSQAVRDLLDQANNEFGLADTALKNGDLAGYQQHVDRGVALIQQARASS